MAKYDIYRNPDNNGYLIELQSELLSGLNTTVVAPLLPLDTAPKPAKQLNPIFNVENESVMMATQYLAAIPLAELGAPLGKLENSEAAISAALDLVFVGF